MNLFTITFSSDDESPPPAPKPPKAGRSRPFRHPSHEDARSPSPPPNDPPAPPDADDSPPPPQPPAPAPTVAPPPPCDPPQTAEKPPETPARPLTVAIYQVTRVVSRGLKGKRIHFQLTSAASAPLLHAKMKTENPRLVQIAKGGEMHFSDSAFEGAIHISEDLSSYSIRRGFRYGDELATIRFTKRIAHDKKQKAPRNVKVTFFGNPKGLPPSIASRAPGQSPIGLWSLDFGSRQIAASVKNAILVDATNTEIVAVMKTGDEVLRIDAADTIHLLIVFGIGIASFLCKLP